MFQTPTRADLLAAQTPDDLFGEAAGDPKALRRAWAVIAKAFRAEDDPEAFQHARDLYEQARQGAGTPSAGGAVVGAPEQTPASALVRAMGVGDAGEVVRLVVGHGEELLLNHAPLFVDVVGRLIGQLGVHLSPVVLDRIDELLRRPDGDLPPPFIREVGADVIRARAIIALDADPRVPRPLVAMVRTQWRCRPDEVAAQWISCREAMASEDLAAVYRYVDERHDNISGQLCQKAVEMQIFARAAAPRGLPDDIVEVWRSRVPPTSLAGGRTARRIDALRALALWRVGATTVAIAILLVMAVLGVGLSGTLVNEDLPGADGVLTASFGSVALAMVLYPALMVFEGILASLAPFLVARARRGELARLAETPLDALLDLARAHALFPGELALELSPLEPLPTGEPDASYDDDHPLLRLERDVSATLRVLTSAHVARVAAGCSKESADV